MFEGSSLSSHEQVANYASQLCTDIVAAWDCRSVKVARADGFFFSYPQRDGLPDGAVKDSLQNVFQQNVVLIPKVEGPERISQFRPISLSSYETHHQGPCGFLSKLVGTSQSSFLPGRNTTDKIIFRKLFIP